MAQSASTQATTARTLPERRGEQVARLLPAAPWVVARGNHELCAKAGRAFGHDELWGALDT